jgi:hypothetical protein
MDFYSGLGDGHSVLILAQSLLEQKAFGSLYLLLWKGFGEGEERIASHGNRQHLGMA